MPTHLQDIMLEYAWVSNVAGVALILATKVMMNTKAAWAGIGGVFLVIAIFNALLLGATGQNPAHIGASLFGLVVLGSLGARFLGNWLTDGAT